MKHPTVLGPALRRRHIPASRRGLDEQRTGHGPCTAQRIPGARRRGRAAGHLRAETRGIDRRLTNFDIGPSSIKLLGDDHGQRGFNPLTDFRLGGIDQDALAGDLQKGIRREGSLRPGSPRSGLRLVQRDAQHQAAAGQPRVLQEPSSIESLGHGLLPETRDNCR